MIRKETITEFRKALEEEYGRSVDFQEASVLLTDMVFYFDLLAKINDRIITQK